MITDPAEFFTKGCGRCDRFDTPECSALIRSAVVKALRQICLEAGLVETAKWGHPCYMHSGRNIALIGAFRDHVRLSFFNAALLTDPSRLLQSQGPNSATPGCLRFDTGADVEAQASAIQNFIAQLKHHAELGTRPPKIDNTPDVPEELIEALAQDDDLSAAYDALTPGRQKSWLLKFNGAKQSQTRINRIAAARDKILAGKGANER